MLNSIFYATIVTPDNARKPIFEKDEILTGVDHLPQAALHIPTETAHKMILQMGLEMRAPFWAPIPKLLMQAAISGGPRGPYQKLYGHLCLVANSGQNMGAGTIVLAPSDDPFFEKPAK